MDDMIKFISTLQQSRSNYELERFVVGQHDTPEMMFHQLCLEIYDVTYKVKNVEIELKKLDLDIDILKSSGNQFDQLTAQQRLLAKEQTMTALAGAKAELNHLTLIWDSFPKKYTREEIEAAQEDYWKARMYRQASSQVIGQGFVDMGQIDGLRQVGILDAFIEEHSSSFTKPEMIEE